MIYDFLGSEHYESVSCVVDGDYDVFNAFQGSPVAENWKPVRVERGPKSEGDPGLPSDFPWLTRNELIMRTRAVVALRDMLEAGGEILPLATDDGVALYAFNVTRVLDAMDEENSIIKRFPDGQIMFVSAFAFRESMVRDEPFFKLPYRGCPILVGERFKERVHAAGLVGLDFRMVWSPEHGAVPRKFC